MPSGTDEKICANIFKKEFFTPVLFTLGGGMAMLPVIYGGVAG